MDAARAVGIHHHLGRDQLINQNIPAGDCLATLPARMQRRMLQMDNRVQIAAGVFITLAIVVGVLGGWFAYDCGNDSIYSVWVPKIQCVAILLGTIFGVLVLGGIGVVLSQVQR